MKVNLFQFQDKALQSIRLHSAMSLDTYNKFKLPQVVSFTAPTGAGKTIIMSAFIENVFWGDDQAPAMPNAIIIWLSDSPELNEQSKLKIDLKADKIRLDQCVTISEDSFDAETLDDGHIYFLNTQKLSKSSNLTKHSDSRQYTIWETLQNTIREKSDRLYFIIDEAHRGAQLRDAGKQTTIMQKFIKGSQADGLSPMPVVIGMSATVERFNTLVADTTSTIHKVVVTPDEVRKSGLLKDKIIIKYPEDQTTNKDMAVLQAAADEWQAKCDHWYQYCYEQHYQQVYPILLVQVQNGKGDKLSNTDLDDCIKKIEDRINYKFSEGEVVHTFGQTKATITLNGLPVPYEEPSAINDNRKIKVVLYKENLSTGWDCPRAETMMSFRVASDATYIAQLLGRMVRTPLKMRVQVDESLNEVHLYLPNFDANTVKDVVDSLQSTEGANIPTDILGESLEEHKTEVLTIKPIVHPTPVETKESPQEDNDEYDGDNWMTGYDNPQTYSQSSNHIANGTATVSHYTPVQSFDPISETIKTRMEVMSAINDAGLIRYDVRKARVNDYLSSLFKLARLLSQSGLYPSASKDVINDIVESIYNHCQKLRQSGEYETLRTKLLEFKMQAQVFDVFGQSVDNNAIHDLFSTTDTDIERQFARADILLGREGVHQAYGQQHCFDYDDEIEYKMDVIIFANDKTCLDNLQKYAEGKYNELNDTYRIRFSKLDERYRSQYDSIVTNGDLVSKHIFTLPEFINVDLQRDGKAYTDHLFLNENGIATFKLTSWEEKVLTAEQKADDFVCWLRNPDRKPWALCIPYEMDNEFRPMYPDFIIIRKSASNEYLFDILEPHNSSLKDNLPKAKGLARYAQMNIGFTRVQLIRIEGDDIIRLDMGKTAIRNKVIAAINNDELDHIFETDGIKQE